jgi:hypothetical protein
MCVYVFDLVYGVPRCLRLCFVAPIIHSYLSRGCRVYSLSLWTGYRRKSLVRYLIYNVELIPLQSDIG